MAVRKTNVKVNPKVAVGLSDEQLRRAVLTGKCSPHAQPKLRALLKHANEGAYEAIAQALGTKAGVVRANLKRAAGLLRDEAAYHGRTAANDATLGGAELAEVRKREPKRRGRVGSTLSR